ncbi:MAG: hypothetical protein JO072_17460 [Parafilimonas sp.]|nr:hypothetical protein [Parafilimonas sp.]
MTKLLREIRILTIFFMVVLIVSGITAFPVYSELQWIINSKIFPDNSTIEQWLKHVWIGVKYMHEQYPFIFYGFDWLAFAHLIIAVLFVGVYQHPVRNRWIIEWGMISCAAVLPLAFIAGSVRGIAFFHILIDCSFGVFGIITLRLIQLRVNKLKKYKSKIKIVSPTQGQL